MSMPTLELYNTLSRAVEPLRPLCRAQAPARPRVGAFGQRAVSTMPPTYEEWARQQRHGGGGHAMHRTGTDPFANPYLTPDTPTRSG